MSSRRYTGTDHTGTTFTIMRHGRGPVLRPLTPRKAKRRAVRAARKANR